MKDQLLATLETSRRYTLSVAEAMPGRQYNTRPVDSVWDFRELMHHIAYGIQWWEENYIKGKKADWDPPATKKNKEEVIDYLGKAYDSLKQTMSAKNLSEQAIQGFHATIDHITHHRGQAVLHLRMQGIVPPEYTF